jgi:hypothetical protein
MPSRALPGELTLELALDDAEDDAAIRRRVAQTLRVAESELPPIVVRKRSLDARRG